MIKIEGGSSNLLRLDGGEIQKPGKFVSVGELELELLSRFPRGDAEPWDRTGLLVGDPAELVTGVAVALDPSIGAIRAAEKAGANVVLTHHPAFIDPPERFSPSYDVASAPGVNVWTAASKGIALMNFHTALDVSRDSVRLLPQMLSLDFERVLDPLPDDAGKGYGSLCAVRASDAPFRLEHLAARCVSVFGRVPRVWGDSSERLSTVVTANGSAGGIVEKCVAAHVDCLVCGELRYHAALDAAQAGLCIVELGHDVSELPLAALLAQATIDAGIASSNVFVHDQSSNWTTPDSRRI